MCVCVLKFLQICFFHETLVIDLPILVTVRSKPWVSGRSLAGISGSNPAENLDVCLLSVSCVVR
jgi:hypothetical protein